MPIHQLELASKSEGAFPSLLSHLIVSIYLTLHRLRKYFILQSHPNTTHFQASDSPSLEASGKERVTSINETAKSILHEECCFQSLRPQQQILYRQRQLVLAYALSWSVSNYIHNDAIALIILPSMPAAFLVTPSCQ